MCQFTKAERSGLKFLFFFAAFITGVIVWIVTNNNVIAFCTIVSLLTACYWLIQAIVAPYRHHNKGMKLPPTNFKATERKYTPEEFNKWSQQVLNQIHKQ